MTYIGGEEMSWYTMQLIMDKWVKPFVDTSKWEYYDLSCKARDETNDKVLHEAVASGQKNWSHLQGANHHPINRTGQGNGS